MLVMRKGEFLLQSIALSLMCILRKHIKMHGAVQKEEVLFVTF